MKKVSVVLAVHNEEKTLKKCLDSVVDFADEIIVVDGESTDKTAEIAKSFSAKVISTTNKQNFHINKQLGNDAAKYPFVLQLDADEQCDKDLISWILELKQTSEDIFQKLPSAWWIKRKNNFLGGYLKKGGQYPDPVIRFFKNGEARLPQKNVHEQMVVDGEIGWAGGHLLHDSNPDLKTYMRKFATYTSFEAQRLKDNKTKPTLSFALSYLFIKPLITFFSLAIRHKGILDGWRGLAFAMLSASHHPIVYLKLNELYEHKA